jgi:hypothetical protein
MVEIPSEISWPGALHPYTFRIDRIIEWNGLFYVEDHKSTSAMGASYFRQFDPSNQMMGYAWTAQQLTGLPIAGVRINAIGVLKTQTKLAREVVSYSQQRLQEWARNYNVSVQRIERSYMLYNLAVDPAFQGDREQLLLQAWPHRFNACHGKYGMCQYSEVCASSPHIRGRLLETYEENPWEPLETFAEEAE